MHETPSLTGAVAPEPVEPGVIDRPDVGTLRRSVSRGVAATFVMRAVGMGLTAMAAILLARALGTGGYGTYSWAFAWASTLATIAALGADQLLLRESAVALDRSDWDGLRALLRSVLGRVTIAAVGAVAVLTALLALAGGGSGTRRAALAVALPILPLAAVAAVGQGSLLGLGRTAAAVGTVTLGRQAVFLILAVVAVLLGGLSSSGAVALQLAATGASCIAVLLLLRRALAGKPRDGAEPRAAARGWLRAAVPMGATTILLVIDAQVGLLVLGLRGRAVDAGVFAAALQCTAPFALLLSAGRLPLGSAVARLGAARDRARLQRGLRTATRGVAGVAALCAAVLVVIPAPILGLFGGGFTGGADALRILAVAQLINAICAFNGLVLIMTGHERAAMGAALGCLVLDAGLCVVLVPPLGARGAAIAVLVSVTARNVVNSLMVRRRLGIDATVIGRTGSRGNDGGG